MFGPEYFTIAGWYQEDGGDTVCTACFGADDLPRGMRGIVDDDGAVWLPMVEAESESWESGLTCDDGSDRDCPGYIFEPHEDYCLEHCCYRDDHGRHGNPDADPECSYYGEDADDAR